MKTIGLNKHECVRNLRLYRDKMEKILSLVEDKLPLPEANKARVEILLKDLNQSLKTDLARYSTARGRSQMSSAEQDFYMPAIHEAAKRIPEEIKSIPNQRWIDDIDTAQKYIRYYLNQLLS